MSYFKNSELADTYHVSDRTVRYWIQLAKEGKLDLALHTEGDKSYLAKTSGNILIIEKHVAKFKKHRPRNAHKIVTPRPEFYRLFTQSQIYDIVRNLEMHHEIPRQYNYFDGGATEWDQYTQELAKEKTPSLLTKTAELLAESQNYLDKRLAKYDRVNVVDIGVGNALPSKGLLAHLIQEKRLGRYIAIDISPEMLDIAERNVKQWFGDKIVIEKYEMDITHERFTNILAEGYLSSTNDTANLVLFFGGTADNFRNPDDAFRTINESMNTNDLLIYSDKLETEEMSPQWFQYSAKPGKLELAPIHRVVFDLLNIDDSFYDVEMGFNERTRQRYTKTRLKVALTLKFLFDEGERVVEFEKGDAILLWRSWQMTAPLVYEQFNRNGFYTLHSSQTDDREYLLTVSQVKRN
ncbi:MAG: L-histidine N(alpha)-methyltransferase [Candidatus Saccharibacteria bacterium]